MKQVTVSLTERHLRQLKAHHQLEDVDSRSAALRDILDEYEELRAECKRREDRIKELEAQLRERSRVEEKVEALPHKIQTAGEYQERRQRLLDEASLIERLKWKVTGVPVDRPDDEWD